MTLKKLSDFNKDERYYSLEVEWPKDAARHEILCRTEINLRRKPCVNITVGFALDAVRRAKKRKGGKSLVCSTMTRGEAFEVLEMELDMMMSGEGQVHCKKYGRNDLILRARLVRNVLVECMEAEWPSYETMKEETGHVFSHSGSHGDRGPYNKGKCNGKD